MAKLPNGYTQLQWIGSTGTQYIDTGYIMTSDNVEYGCKYIGRSPSSKSLFGSETYTVNKYSGVPYGVNPYTRVYIGNTSWDSVDQTPTLGENIYTLKYDGVTLTTILNGIIKTVEAEIIIQKELPIYVFANNRSGTTIQQTSIKMRSFYIKDDGELVVNLIPAKRNSDGVVGMYDLISNTFLTNQGTGDFIAGPEYPKCNVYGVSVKGGSLYTRLEYLESTGTQYIVVPYKVNSNDTIKSRYMQTGTTTEIANIPFGVTNSASPTDAKKGFVRTAPGSTSLSRVGYGDGDGTVKDLSVPKYIDLNTWYSIIYNTDGTVYINNNLVATLPTSTWTADYDFALFSRKIGNSVTFKGKFKISSFEIEGKINLVPVQRNSDGVLGMLDLISNTFYTNAGTGEFIAGPKI